MSSSPEKETLDRVRRIETRITKIGNHMGVDVGGGTPSWCGDHIVTSSANTSIKALVEAIPKSHHSSMVRVFVSDDYLATITINR